MIRASNLVRLLNKLNPQKTLGLTLDENLTWKNHVDAITKKISSGISALKRVRGLIDNETAIKAYQGLIEHYFSWGGGGVGRCC